MIELFLTIIIVALIILGVGFIYTKSASHLHTLPAKTASVCVVLSVRNCEDSIEGIVRSWAWRIMSHQEQINELVVVDMGSDDSTFLILKNLSREYPFLRLIQKPEYKDITSVL